MNGTTFVELINALFQPIATSAGMNTITHIDGRLYLAEFSTAQNVVSVSYEVGDEDPRVMIFSVKNGIRSDPDDLRSTPRLADLNRRYVADGGKEFHGALASSPQHQATDPVERRLIKAAGELKVVLPWYLRRSENE